MAEQYTFQTEVQQVLDILIHSLYTEREIFLRELISNASDALNRLQFEMLTNHDVLAPDAELRIDIRVDEAAGTLTVSDTGVGMTREEMIENLGTIAHSGARAFLEAVKEAQDKGVAQDVIGQFGVGFYAVFMVADRVRVVSRSFRKDAEAVAWESDGGTTYTIEPAEREHRGTDIIIYLKDDAKEFLQTHRLREVIRRHSDYISFPIYVGDDEEPTNRRQALWRQSPSEVEEKQYQDFYRMMTMDFEGPFHTIHMRADVPLQFYALLFFPSSPEPNIFSPRKEPGLMLYARKVLIQEYSRDLLPEYLSWVQGVVDSEDIPLNVSRESVQANRIIAKLRQTLKNKVLSELKRLAKNERETYLKIYHQFHRYLKQGLVAAPEDRDDLQELLLFTSSQSEGEQAYSTLAEYVDRMAQGQEDIYYLIADDYAAAARSPHLEAFRRRGIEVLFFTDPIDSIIPVQLPEYHGHKLRAADEADIDLSEIGELQEDDSAAEPLADEAFEQVRARFEAVLGERVKGVKASQTLVGSPARLVNEDGAQGQMFRLNRLLNRDYELPVKTLELNPRHPLLHNLSARIAQGDDALVDAVIEQIFETALLQDGIHPDPASMAERLTMLMEAATRNSQTEHAEAAEAN